MSDQLALSVSLTVIALLIAATGGLALRRTLIIRRGGVVESWLRHSPGAPWRHGLAEYRGGQLYWHRALSLRLRPHAAFDRSQLSVLSSRPALAAQEVLLGPGLTVATCQVLIRHRGRQADRREVELAMSQAALTGLLSWLEASPIYLIRRAGLRSRRSGTTRAASAPRLASRAGRRPAHSLAGPG